jgi:hypothetical protein
VIVFRAMRAAAMLLGLLASGALAQASGPISFDALPRRLQPVHAAATRSDTAAARRRGQSAKPATPRVDTVHVSHVDTVLISRVDTVKILTIVASTAATPAVIPPAFAVSGLTQVMLTGGDAVRSTYRLRRVEMKITADLGDHVQAVMMVDPAKALSLNTSGAQPAVTQSSRILQDAFITMPLRRMTVDAGQQRLPLGYEGAMSASGLETVERALMESDKARFASFGDVRDAGVSVRRTWTALDYKVGVFNGSGETMNDVDRQVGKAVVGQLGFRPNVLPGVRVGLSGATSGRGAGDNPTRDRIGADLRVVRGPVSLQTEIMAGQDGPTHRLGWYALSTFTPRKGFKVVSRVDVFDPDLATDVYPTTVGECDYLAGFSWLPAATRLKLQINVVHKTYTAGLGPSSTLVLSQLQASW